MLQYVVHFIDLIFYTCDGHNQPITDTPDLLSSPVLTCNPCTTAVKLSEDAMEKMGDLPQASLQNQQLRPR